MPHRGNRGNRYANAGNGKPFDPPLADAMVIT
jgi:hypothetical protein